MFFFCIKTIVRFSRTVLMYSLPLPLLFRAFYLSTSLSPPPPPPLSLSLSFSLIIHNSTILSSRVVLDKLLRAFLSRFLSTVLNFLSVNNFFHIVYNKPAIRLSASNKTSPQTDSCEAKRAQNGIVHAHTYSPIKTLRCMNRISI